MTTLKIAIQGDLGSNHHLFCQKIFHEYDQELVCAKSFPELAKELTEGNVDIAVMAIENSIAGSILANYDLLTNHDFQVIGEANLRIQHCLIGLEEATVKDIKIAYSHEMALKQCQDFLQEHKIEAREYFDTAASVPFVKSQNDKTIAGIAPAIAAQIYNLKILATGIETSKANYTRFVILARNKDSNTALIEKLKKHLEHYSADATKVMLEFNLSHEPGSLVKVLETLYKANCNLTKIESRPIIGESWHYRFYVDFTTIDATSLKKVLANVKKHCDHLKIHGIFPQGQTFEP